MRKLLTVFAVALLLTCATACQTRVVVIGSDDIVRITSGKAVIWTTPDGGETWVKQGKAKLPDGAYVSSDLP